MVLCVAIPCLNATSFPLIFFLNLCFLLCHVFRFSYSVKWIFIPFYFQRLLIDGAQLMKPYVRGILGMCGSIKHCFMLTANEHKLIGMRQISGAYI